MELLPAELRRQLPALYSQSELNTHDKTVHIRYFFPLGKFDWYVLEGSPQESDFLFYGYIVGLGAELRYFTLSQLEKTEVCGIRIARDENFEPISFRELLK